MMHSRRFLPKEMAALAAILLLAAVFRYWQIAANPRALHFDEAINGLVVQDLLRGRLPKLLTYQDAREPLIYYIMAISVFVLGPTPGALRLSTASMSLLLVGAGFLLARELLGRKAALLAALICATTVWPIYHGRLATRSILVPVVLSMALYASLVAWRANRARHWVAAGTLFGAVFYTYATNLFVIPMLGLTLLALLAFDRRALWGRRGGLLLAGAIFLVVGAPILLYRAAHAEVGLGRSQQLLMFYPGQSMGDLINTVSSQAFLVARMFFIRGDLNIRHNIPGRPTFDVVMTPSFLLGLGALWKRETRRLAALVALWLAVWLAPTFLTKDAPHFLRASGALAMLFMWPALGLGWLKSVLKQRAGNQVALLIVSAVVGGSIVITARDYIFSDFLASPEITKAYSGEHIVPILEYNRQHQLGWVGDNLRALPEPAEPLPPGELERARNFPQPYAQYLIPWLFDPSLVQY